MSLTTVAIRHVGGQRATVAGLICTTEVRDLLSLFVEAKKRYDSKVTGTEVDPYVIEEWTQDPENIPRLAWSGRFMSYRWVHRLNSHN